MSLQAGLGGNRSQAQIRPLRVRPREQIWFKIRNREYSQMVGREELFERERHKEPVAGLALLGCGVCWARTPQLKLPKHS